MTSIPLDAQACSCGHLFDHDDTGKTLTSEEIRVQAEELYASYLTARAEQAASELMCAQARYARDPGNQQKSSMVADALDEAATARAALAGQSARVTEMKKALAAATRPVPVHVPIVHVPQAAPEAPIILPAIQHAQMVKPAVAEVSVSNFVPPKQEISRPAQAKQQKSSVVASAPDAVTAARAGMARQSTRVTELKKAIVADSHAVTANAPVAQAQPATTAATIILPATQHAPKAKPARVEVIVTGAAAPKRNIAPLAHVEAKKTLVLLSPASQQSVPEQRAVAQPVQTATPNSAFRQAQAAKARKILHAHQATKSAPIAKREKISSIPKTEKKPSPSFAIPANSKEAPRLYVDEKKQDCPNCTARVSRDVFHCRCGYEFPSSVQLIPSVSMSDEERLEFSKLFNYP